MILEVAKLKRWEGGTVSKLLPTYTFTLKADLFFTKWGSRKRENIMTSLLSYCEEQKELGIVG